MKLPISRYLGCVAALLLVAGCSKGGDDDQLAESQRAGAELSRQQAENNEQEAAQDAEVAAAEQQRLSDEFEESRRLDDVQEALGVAHRMILDRYGYDNDTGAECPPWLLVKGNRGVNGLIYHLPKWTYYDVTIPEDCFATDADAEAAGYRQSLVH